MRNRGLLGGLQMVPRKSKLFSLPVAPPCSCQAWAWQANVGHKPKVHPNPERQEENIPLPVKEFLLLSFTLNNWHSFRRLGSRPLWITKTLCKNPSINLPFSQIHLILLFGLASPPQEAETTKDLSHWGACKSQVKSWVLLRYPVISDEPPHYSENMSSCGEKSCVTAAAENKPVTAGSTGLA